MSKHRLNILLGILLAAFTVLSLFARFGIRKYTAADFTGRSEQDVTRWIEEEQIPSETVIISHVYSELPEGIVLHQNIKENGTFSSNRALVLTVSKGEDPYQRIELIDFAEMDQKQIEDWLKQNGFVNYTFSTEINEEKEEGSFLYSSPQTGSRITKDTEIHIVMCEHDHSTTVALPDFTGKTTEDIDAWAAENDIIPAYYYYFDTSPAGSFLYCDVETGTILEKGTSLGFAISSGPGQ